MTRYWLREMGEGTMLNIQFKLVMPSRELRSLLVRISPISVLAFVIGLLSLFLPWAVYSSAGDIGFTVTGEFTRVSDIYLTDSFLHDPNDSTYPSMIYLIVVGFAAILYTSLAVVPLEAGLLLFFHSVWGTVGVLYYGPGSVNYVSYGLAPYLAVLVCVLGVLSAIPRISPSIVLIRTS